MRIRTVLIGLLIFVAGAATGAGLYRHWTAQQSGEPVAVSERDPLFGWKIPVNSIAFSPTGQNLFDFQIAYSDIRDPGGVPSGLPVRLKVPVIGVDTAIEDAYITPDGRMDVPQGSVNVAWFALGPKPGTEGSSVIGGHFGQRNGVPFVFYNLDKLKVGDKVYVVDDRGSTLAFIVRTIKLFERDADATPVFTSSDGLAHLNLITCEGIWNKINDTYPLRRVVFTDAIPSEGSVNVTASVSPIPTPGASPAVSHTPAPSAAPSLSFGATGADVTTLQNILVQKGFLTIPTGIAKGYYGTTTRDAVANYQTSVGLPSTGVYDTATRAMLTAEPTLPSTALDTPTPTSTPTPSVTLIPTPVPSQNPSAFVGFLQGLFATTKDGIITSLLLLAIIVMSWKIFSRPGTVRRK